jgi:hypothetical protein
MSDTDPDLKPTERNRPIAIDVVDGNLVVKRHSGKEESFPLGSGGGISIIDSAQVVVRSHGTESYFPGPNQPLIIPDDTPTQIDWTAYYAGAGFVQLAAIQARTPVFIPELGIDAILLAENVYLDSNEDPFVTIYIVGEGAYEVGWYSSWEQAAVGRRGMQLSGIADDWARDEHPVDEAGFPIYKRTTMWVTPSVGYVSFSLFVEQTSGGDLGMRSAEVAVQKIL